MLLVIAFFWGVTSQHEPLFGEELMEPFGQILVRKVRVKQALQRKVSIFQNLGRILCLALCIVELN